MKNKLVCASVISVALLAACGSGGSGSGVSANSGSASTSPSTTPKVTEFKQAGYLVDTSVSSNVATAKSDGSSYTYEYGGQVLNVTLPNTKAQGLVSMTDGNGLVTSVGGSTYSYSRFGAVFSDKNTSRAEVFSIGTPTENMPTTG